MSLKPREAGKRSKRKAAKIFKKAIEKATEKVFVGSTIRSTTR